MRAILHIGLFMLALTAMGQASADDDDRRRERRTTIIIAPQGNQRAARPVRPPVAPPPPRHDWRAVRHGRARGIVDARREVYEQQRDHDEIVRITDRWTQATRARDPRAQRNAERRAHLWIDREIEESNRKPDHGRYVHRLHSLRRELSVSNGQQGHARGHRRGRQRFDAHKAQVLGELVTLSQRQVQHAKARARGQMHMAFAYR